MKQHKFKRIALDLIERIDSDDFKVEYSLYAISFWAKQDGEYKHLYLTNHKYYDQENLEKYELAKKVIAGEEQLLDE
ncbi:hypothetical protein BU107_11115 [Staphylococcus xylosus]|uniref:hypothetical protein n=1 Tax=Staphylococcus xylosus TaxID=1288 RepID=UPI000E67DB8B|nr:hypothetical protein [Staphylococcus xylosus]RIM85833.1 hypothetical protein BU107_11115 [Staphylococcus xylosus]